MILLKRKKKTRTPEEIDAWMEKYKAVNGFYPPGSSKEFFQLYEEEQQAKEALMADDGSDELSMQMPDPVPAGFEETLRDAAHKALHEAYHPSPTPVPEGYEALHAVLHRALCQASGGKGKERHASGEAFDEQPMQTISDLLGDHRGLLFQAIKKARESVRLPPGRDVNEILGAINYLAGAVIWLESNRADSN